MSAREFGERAVSALHSVTHSLAHGEERPGQDDMVRSVAESLSQNRSIIVQAGTGTGKSLGYLVPAILSGRTTVVATATKALQDQLHSHDLPLLAEHLDHEFTWAVVKGRSNYVCRQRVEEFSSPADTFDFDDLSAQVKEEIAEVAAWSRTSSTGDLEEYPGNVLDRTRMSVTVQSDECPGRDKCPQGNSCFAERAREAAAAADVIIVNYHLYGAHISSGGFIIPEHEVVVFDEVQQLEAIMSDTVGVQISPGRLSSLAAVVRKVIASDEPDTLLKYSDALYTGLSAHAGKRLASPLPLEVSTPLSNTRLTLNEILQALREIQTDNDDLKQRVLRAQSQCTRLATHIDTALGPIDGFVAYVEGSSQRPVLAVSPLHVGNILSEAVWDNHVAVLTSATVPITLPERIGLASSTTDIISVPSPFDYEKNSLLYCSPLFPDRNDPKFDDFVHDELAALITAAGGRTLALFTSNRALDLAAAEVQQRVPFPILTPRNHTRSQLIAQFMENEEACIFASQSFFQGVDLPGRTLSLVVLDKLPFPRPDDPLLGARRDAVGRDESFNLIDLPLATTALAQAAGRLIRTANDKGVVAVLDRRLAKMRYSKVMLDALPPMSRTRNRSDVEDFLRHITQSRH